VGVVCVCVWCVCRCVVCVVCVFVWVCVCVCVCVCVFTALHKQEIERMPIPALYSKFVSNENIELHSLLRSR